MVWQGPKVKVRVQRSFTLSTEATIRLGVGSRRKCTRKREEWVKYTAGWILQTPTSPTPAASQHRSSPYVGAVRDVSVFVPVLQQVTPHAVWPSLGSQDPPFPPLHPSPASAPPCLPNGDLVPNNPCAGGRVGRGAWGGALFAPGLLSRLLAHKMGNTSFAFSSPSLCKHFTLYPSLHLSPHSSSSKTFSFSSSLSLSLFYSDTFRSPPTSRFAFILAFEWHSQCRV